MIYRLLHTIENTNPTKLSIDSLADFVYILGCCKFPASIIDDDFHQSIAHLCDKKIKELQHEYANRCDGNSCDTASYFDKACEYFGITGPGQKRSLELFAQLISEIDLSKLSCSELLKLHALSPLWYELRQQIGMESFTRVYFWNIVHAMEDSPVREIAMWTEYLESENYAKVLNLSYNLGESLVSFDETSCVDDSQLIERIKILSDNRSYVNREELISIADYIRIEIVAKNTVAEHIQLVNVILNTDMPRFKNPCITEALEKAAKQLANTGTKTLMDLAPLYRTLWQQTLKPIYLSKFEETLKHCYLFLTTDKVYPNLGIDEMDSESVDKAINFLRENRKSLWNINDKYDVDKVIQQYQPCLQ